ncbi:von Willebrand factor type A domain protein [Halobacteriovorax sp. BALOs_7]|uniref:VWA domain-containing protein n=1 Tax=Halobacteriovorax sp. BALOs_7 TaxID=2109558 RepID=UPI000EA19928|nr:VWA domain-containing protein [Halobacteriovorax sp. BALOs_7]AYF43159.1 von Willebrand factor type A domain protein [Halobacteriovorax sp. BALOs_7]
MLDSYVFQNKYLFIAGLVGLLFWILDFFSVMRKGELILPPKYRTQNVFSIMRGILLVLGVISWLLISFALMGPKTPMGKSNVKKEINDIYFVVDVSRSMLAEDFPPNRLEAAKEQIRKFVELSPVDRIGIIMFGDKVFTLIPVTTDLKLVEQSIEQIKIGFLGSGTNIGDALGLALARSETSIAANKSIVLLTDGSANAGLMSPMQAAEKAKELGIKIYTIGIGGDPNAKLPVGRDAYGRKRYQNMPGQSMDFETLRKIAQESGGKDFVASDNDSLNEVLSEINKLERKGLEIKGRIIYKEDYYKYLMAGFFLLVFVESVRRIGYREVA